MVMGDLQKVIDSFGQDTPFMSDSASARTQARRKVVDSAAPDIQALKGTLSNGLVERLARLDVD